MMAELSPSTRSGMVVRRAVGQFAQLALRRPLTAVGIVAFVPRILLAVFVNRADIWSLAPDSVQYLAVTEAAADGRLATFWFGYGESLFQSTRTFTLQILLLFEVFGPSRFAVQCVAVLYGVLAAVLTVVVARRLVRPGYALSAGLVVALLPSQIAFSSAAIRESLIWCLLALTIFFVFRSGRAERALGSIGWMVATAGPIFLMSYLRVHSALLVTWCLIGGLLLKGRTRLGRSLAVVLLVVLLPVSMGMGPGGVEYASASAKGLGTVRAVLAMSAESAIAAPSMSDESAVVAPSMSDESAVVAPSMSDESAVAAGDPTLCSECPLLPADEGSTAAGPADEGSATVDPAIPAEPAIAAGGSTSGPTPGVASAVCGVECDVAPSLPGDILQRVTEINTANKKFIVDAEGRHIMLDNDLEATLASFPHGLVSVTLRPFPWEADGGFGRTAAALESPIWLLLILLSVVGIVAKWRSSDEAIFLMVQVALFTGAAAVTQGNLGTAFRHRGQVLVALVVLSMVGIEHLRDRRSRNGMDKGGGQGMSHEQEGHVNHLESL
jgi:hypothetical protein